MGRDIAAAHTAYRNLARVLYDRLRRDVNRFIDGTYAPQQIKAAMQRQQKLFLSKKPAEQRKSLFLPLEKCSRQMVRRNIGRL